MTLAERYTDLMWDTPDWAIATIVAATALFWTGVAVHRYDMKHLPIKEEHPDT